MKQYIINNNLEVDIEADGGINQDTVQDVKKAGVDIIVAGSAIVKSDDFGDAINKLKN